MDPVSTNGLEGMKKDTSFHVQEDGQFFPLDNCQSYQRANLKIRLKVLTVEDSLQLAAGFFKNTGSPIAAWSPDRSD